MPATYPSLTIAFPFGERPRPYGVLRTEYEQGYIQTRAKWTTGPRAYLFSHEHISSADVATWLNFWDAQKGGGDAFNFTDPRTAATVLCRFAMPDVLPDDFVKRTGPQTYTVGPIKLEEVL